MTMAINATEFRKNLFRCLDECRRSGAPVEIDRSGERFLVIPVGTRKRIGDATPRPGVIRDPESLPGFSPSEWDPER
jgi:hypothetical protein